MKTFKIIIALVLVFAICISVFSVPAQAAIMSASMLGAGLIAVAASAGVIYASASQSQASLTQWAQNRIDSWLDGRSIAEAFGAEYIRMVHGKLIIPAVIYNAINDMINDDVTESGITPGGEARPLVTGLFYDKEINLAPVVPGQRLDPAYISISYDFTDSPSSSGFSSSFNRSTGVITNYVDGVVLDQFNPGWGSAQIRESVVNYAFARSSVSTSRAAMMVLCNWNGYAYLSVNWYDIPAAGDTNIRLEQAWEEDYCDVGYQWEGNISGSEADTNIDDLIDTIYKEASADTLGVTGEIETETPYPPQPTEYPIDDVLGGMDTINESINERGEDITDAIGSVVDGIHSQTGTIADSAASAAEAVTDAVGSLEGTLEDALDIPTASAASSYKWDLRQLFPFCIPFDIAAMLQAFDGVAAAPHIQIPVVIQSIGFNYILDLDFSPFNPVAAILRQVELIAFGIALAWGTSKVIRW